MSEVKLKYYRELSEEELRRDMQEFLRWLLKINKGNIIKVSVRQYNRWPGGYAPLSPQDALAFNRFFASLVKQYRIRCVEKYEVKRGKYSRYRRWLIKRSQLQKLVQALG